MSYKNDCISMTINRFTFITVNNNNKKYISTDFVFIVLNLKKKLITTMYTKNCFMLLTLMFTVTFNIISATREYYIIPTIAHLYEKICFSFYLYELSISTFKLIMPYTIIAFIYFLQK